MNIELVMNKEKHERPKHIACAEAQRHTIRATHQTPIELMLHLGWADARAVLPYHNTITTPPAYLLRAITTEQRQPSQNNIFVV